MPAIEKVLLVGHCGSDAMALKHAVEQAAGKHAVHVRTAMHTDDDVLSADGRTLLLVNRELGNVLSKKRGIDLIRELSAKDDPPPMMLISNFEDAQREAEAAGALPGFGKSQLHDAQTRERLERMLNANVHE